MPWFSFEVDARARVVYSVEADTKEAAIAEFQRRKEKGDIEADLEEVFDEEWERARVHEQ